MTLNMTHEINKEIKVAFKDQELFRYDYSNAMDQKLCPKPEFHPIKTLQGDVVTCNKPFDHIWHQGLSMTSAEVSGQNFWGGPSYDEEEGYVDKDNWGSQEHVKMLAVSIDKKVGTFSHQLNWLTMNKEHWFDERRKVSFEIISNDVWKLTFSTALKNVFTKELVFGSPTTKGRPNAGYGSFFWRGPREFEGQNIFTSEGLGIDDSLSGRARGRAMEAVADEAMGKSADWLAFTSQHDGSMNYSTLIFKDCPTNPNYPNKWFVRNKPYACVSYSFMFDEKFPLQPNDTLNLSYDLYICNGKFTFDDVESVVKQ